MLLQIICCTAARTTLTGDLARVEEQGIVNITKAFQVPHRFQALASGPLCGAIQEL